MASGNVINRSDYNDILKQFWSCELPISPKQVSDALVGGRFDSEKYLSAVLELGVPNLKFLIVMYVAAGPNLFKTFKRVKEIRSRDITDINMKGFLSICDALDKDISMSSLNYKRPGEKINQGTLTQSRIFHTFPHVTIKVMLELGPRRKWANDCLTSDLYAAPALFCGLLSALGIKEIVIHGFILSFEEILNAVITNDYVAHKAEYKAVTRTDFEMSEKSYKVESLKYILPSMDGVSNYLLKSPKIQLEELLLRDWIIEGDTKIISKNEMTDFDSFVDKNQ